jgi:tRNA pseudouridine55 synthase
VARAHAGIEGVLVLDKPEGPSSHACVVEARRRRLAKKVGHAGTLDPFAAGVLPLLLGAATRLSRFYTGARKRYDAVVRFGTATTTCDPAGDPCGEGPVPGEAALEEALERFRGTFEQVPPAFSAKSVDGVRSYKRARQGDLTPPPPAAVEIRALALTAWAPPDAFITVECSAGTYIRSLARDLGAACGSAAHCAALRRTGSGDFGLEGAVTLDELASLDLDELRGRVVPLRDLLPHLPAVTLTPRAIAALRHGKLLLARECEVPAGALEAEWVRMVDDGGALLALGSNAARFNRPEDFHASLVLAR